MNPSSMLKDKLRQLFNAPLMLRLRLLLNFRPPFSYKPANPLAPISDLFFWKQDDEWDTCFHLINIGTCIFPNEPINDTILLNVWDNKGNILVEKKFILSPHAMSVVTFSELGVSGSGSFACFHQIDCQQRLAEHHAHITDRGYVGYRYKQGLWNYVHGNLPTTYYDLYQSNGVRGMLLQLPFGKSCYKPQVCFKDCDKLAIILVNSSEKKQNVILQLRLSNGEKIIKRFSIGRFATEEILIDNETRLIQQIFVISRIVLFRPLIMKYYAHYFDALHA